MILTATQYWKVQFDEGPHTDSEKLAVAIMSEYAIYCRIEWEREAKP